MPSPTSGMDTIAPSGKFCMAIPIESANAPVIETPTSPMAAPAYTTPTAIPSGMLWSVTANIIIVVFCNFALTPSGLSLSKCRCGIKVSRTSRNTIPRTNPISAGTHAIFPCASAMSMDGMSSDHMDAAIMTPAANPSSAFSTIGDIFSFIRNTIAAPRVVPANGINNVTNSAIQSPLYNM